jgi:FixJ family two-component response regulator
MNQKLINCVIVDDDESFARALGRLIHASGFEVRTYPSAEAFLAPARLPEPDCLVLDIQLGGMSGLDLQRRLRELHSPVPIVFVTAHDAPGVRGEAEQGGCSAYLLKPVGRQTLLEAINKAIHGGASTPKTATGVNQPE